MPRELRVYGWLGFRRSASGPRSIGQVRLIVAARSKAEAARIADYDRPSQMFNLGETGNREEIETAMAQPGVVFWRSIDTHRGPWSTGDD